MRQRKGPFNLKLDEFVREPWFQERLPANLRGAKPKSTDHPEFVRHLKRKYHLEDQTSWDSYGQGFASFVDVWFYKDTAEFRLPPHSPRNSNFTGLWVLLCRRLPCFVMGEGQRRWSKKSGSSYTPSFSQVDRFDTAAVRSLSANVERVLVEHGMTRLLKRDVETALPDDIEIESNLIDGHPRIFDALFYWYD